MPDPLVHVLVINWNGLEHLEACYDSLLANAYENVRFVLVDNASSDGSIAFVKDRYGHDPRVEVLALPENRGWSGGNNAGIERALNAGADYLFLLNNDTAVSETVLRELVDASEADPTIGALAPKMLIFDAPEILNSTGLYCSINGASWDKGIGRLDGPRWNQTEEVVGVCGGAMWLRAGAVRQAGILPEDFEIYLDDLDLSLRIWKAGYRILSCPAATVRHKFSATLGTGNRALHKYYLNTRNRFWLMMRQFPDAHRLEFLPAVVAGECRAIGRALLDREPARAWAHVRAWGAALGYAPAARAYRKRENLPHGAERFWPLLLRTPWFCPGTIFPVHGWYPEVEVDGVQARPFAASAWLESDSESLRVIVLNRYPDAGVLSVTVACEGAEAVVLTVAHREEVVVHPASGIVGFRASRILPAEETGELVDIGGWIAVAPVNTP